MDDHRYRLTITTTAGRTVMDGRWSNLATAERKFRSWIGSYSAIPNARIALAEQAADATWTELKAWPNSEA
ncbi:hypothetical protein [Streptomyces sp. NPDC056512]|uniref:hypothetical protein n=1 Tax=Streptomyces sp. NPDC056512 TaxID=3345846 RepID=UPI0036B5D5A0